MRTERVWANTIEKAAEQILKFLKEKTNTIRSVSSRDNIFYFDGWGGLGASAVLRAIATPTSPAGKSALAEMEFDQVIHIDCSMWESKRALQREVVAQLGLPDKVVEMFDRQDEEDDFHGVAHGSRAELEQVAKEIHQHILQKMNYRFMVIFHNGSNEEIDLASLCGFPLSGYSTNKVLWTFQGRFRLKPRTQVDAAMKSAGTTDIFIYAIKGYPTSRYEEGFPPKLWSYLVHKEASELAEACKINTGPCGTIIQPAQVAKCFLYVLGLCCRGHHSDDYDWDTHGGNYWICDGIIQQVRQGDTVLGIDDGNDDELWITADALHCEMPLDVDYHQYLPSSHLARFVESKPCWISPNYGFSEIPDITIPNGDVFPHYFDKLRVLKLSRCTLNC